MNISELEFYPHPSNFGECAIVNFENGYAASIVTGKLAYASEEFPYEVAVLKEVGNEYDLCYDTPITDDVLKYQSASNVERVLKQISELPKEDV